MFSDKIFSYAVPHERLFYSLFYIYDQSQAKEDRGCCIAGSNVSSSCHIYNAGHAR